MTQSFCRHFRHSTKCNNTESMICGHFHLIRKHWSVYDRMLDVAIKWKFTTISWRLSLWIHNFVGLATLASRCEWCWTFGVEMAINHNSRFPCIGLAVQGACVSKSTASHYEQLYFIHESDRITICRMRFGWITFHLGNFSISLAPHLGLRVNCIRCYLESIENKSIDFN